MCISPITCFIWRLSMPSMAETVHTQHLIRAQSSQAALLPSQTCLKYKYLKVKVTRRDFSSLGNLFIYVCLLYSEANAALWIIIYQHEVSSFNRKIYYVLFLPSISQVKWAPITLLSSIPANLMCCQEVWRKVLLVGRGDDGTKRKSRVMWPDDWGWSAGPVLARIDLSCYLFNV